MKRKKDDLHDMEVYATLQQRIDFYKKQTIGVYEGSAADACRIPLNLAPENRRIQNQLQLLTGFWDADGNEYYRTASHTEHSLHPIPSHGILHRHQFIELLYVLEGSFDQILLGEQLHFTQGSIVITDQNCDHCECYLPQNSTVLFLQLSPQFMDELLSAQNQKDVLLSFLFQALDSQKREQSFLELKRNAAGEDLLLQELLNQLYREAQQQEPGYMFMQRGLMTRLLHRLCTEYTPILHSASKTAKESALLFALERYLHLHYAEVCASDLEAHFHYHRNYYNLLLKRYRGKSFKEYILELRLAKAKELLETTDLPVKQIANLVGYENISHFYHLYQKQYGHRVSECRKKTRRFTENVE